LEKPLSTLELLNKLPAAVRLDAVAGKNFTVQLNMSIPAYFTITQGACSVYDGVADAPNVVLNASEENLLRVLTGELSGLTAIFTGKLKVSGRPEACKRSLQLF